MKKIITSLAAIILLNVLQVAAQTPLWQGKGRIAMSSDGNEHDHDDWAATPLSLAMLASKGLQDKLVLYTYADHIWGSNKDKPNYFGKTAYQHIKDSALEGKKWFGFDNSNFMCAVDDPEAAYNAMAKVINESSKKNPLIIIPAGPMQVVGEAINRSKKSKRKYVTVLSHSIWNNEHSDKCSSQYDERKSWDVHSGWTFDEMRKAFESKDGGSVKFVQIKNQNGGNGYKGLKVPKAEFDWIKTSKARNYKAYKKGSWDWLYERVSMVKTEKGTKHDASDAGMMIYLLTGEENTSPELAQKILENPTVK